LTLAYELCCGFSLKANETQNSGNATGANVNSLGARQHGHRQYQKVFAARKRRVRGRGEPATAASQKPCEISAVVGTYGPNDFNLREYLIALFGGRQIQLLAQDAKGSP
jgi:hypothetical protein